MIFFEYVDFGQKSCFLEPKQIVKPKVFGIALRFNTSLKNSACHQLDLIFSRGNILHKKTTWVNDGSGKKDLRSWKTLPELLHSYLMHIWTSFIRYHPNIINPIYIIWPNCILIFMRITPLLVIYQKLLSVNNIWYSFLLLPKFVTELLGTSLLH